MPIGVSRNSMVDVCRGVFVVGGFCSGSLRLMVPRALFEACVSCAPQAPTSIR